MAKRSSYLKPLTILLVTLFILSGCDLEGGFGASEEVMKEEQTTEEVPAEASGDAEFIFFDIGQGDSSLIYGPGGETILIDTGRHDDDRIFGLLEQENLQSIDLLVLTHPHADHIGNADKIIEMYKPSEIWMSGEVHTSKTFERVIDAALDSDADYEEPRVGESKQVGNFTLDILNPHELTGHLNDGSIVFTLTYNDFSILYTGDAEKEAEEDMVNSGLLTKVDVLKVGHHGSHTSSHDFFLNEVQPAVAIYSAESGNSYGHPHKEALERLSKINATIYGTDQYGTIRVLTDGSTYEVITEKDGGS